MHSRFFGVACLFALVAMAGMAQADVIVSVLDSNGGEVEPGGTGQLSINIDSSVLLSGVSLNLFAEGPARITGASVLNPTENDPAAPRWTFKTDGQVSDNQVLSLDGGAFIGLGANGFGPGDDPLFATVDYVFDGSAGESADISLGIGTNIFGFNAEVAPIRLGGPEAPPTDNTGGTRGGTAVILVGIPEPSTLALVGLACVGLIGLRRRS